MKNYLGVLRIKEIVGKAGFFMVGVLFSKPAITLQNFFHVIQFLLLCLLNGLAVYLMNASLGYKQDRTNERLKDLRQVSRASLYISSLLLSLIALTSLYFFSHTLLLPALAVYIIWILYSLPYGLKGIPAMGIACAFVGQLFHFHIGYLVFSHVSLNSILLSLYFSILFAGGHALHEVIDYEADKLVNLKTSAVFFGTKRTQQLSKYLFLSGALYLVILVWVGVLAWGLILPYIAALVIQMGLLFKLPANCNNDQLFEYRRNYMAIYMLATIAAILSLYICAGGNVNG